jgi:hypothetical protein
MAIPSGPFIGSPAGSWLKKFPGDRSLHREGEARHGYAQKSRCWRRMQRIAASCP